MSGVKMASRMMIAVCRDGGLTKFGVTPGGGFPAGRFGSTLIEAITKHD
jgi:IMP dehydrogenase/GMP reductase